MIQTCICLAPLHSKQTLLVCAASKIAMLAVLQQIRADMCRGRIQKQELEVVYVAPMKALTAEVTGAFSSCSEPLGMPRACTFSQDLQSEAADHLQLDCEHGMPVRLTHSGCQHNFLATLFRYVVPLCCSCQHTNLLLCCSSAC